jgi:hypothetical protein
MEEAIVYQKINRILKDTESSVEINSLEDLHGFLADEGNTRMAEYEVIEQLYTQLLEDAITLD